MIIVDGSGLEGGDWWMRLFFLLGMAGDVRLTMEAEVLPLMAQGGVTSVPGRRRRGA